MHLLIVLRSSHYFRLVEGIVREIGERGGRVTLITDEPARLKISPDLAAAGWFQAGPMLPNTNWTWRTLSDTRRLRDYVHWLALDAQPQPVVDQLCAKVPGNWGRVARRLRRLHAEGLLTAGGFRKSLAWLERAATPSANIYQQIRETGADLVLLVSKVFGISPETDYQKACQALGIPSAVFVATWDNLTSKGTFHVPPDWVVVWNGIQVEEAVRYHQIPRSKVVAVGAPVFDDVFDDKWLVDRRQFCQRAGLDPALPFIVYGVSSPRMWGDETQVVANLSRELRRLPGGASVQLLVRPHPKKRRGWEGFAPNGVRVWPTPSLPDTAAAKSDLYNALYHSAGLVGLSTSMFLEAAILDRPGVTFQFQDHDRLGRPAVGGSAADYSIFLHFKYLLDGGFLELVADEAECAQALMAVLSGRDDKREARRAFVSSFVRPGGLDHPARRVAVDALETIASSSAADVAQAFPSGRAFGRAVRHSLDIRPSRAQPDPKPAIDRPGN